MPNLFVNLPAPTSNAAGAAVDVSGMGKTKSVVVGGPFSATVNIEYATDADGTNFAPLASFQGPGNITIDVAAHWMRAVVSSYKSGAANVDVGGAESGSSSVQIPTPPSGGVGAQVAIDNLPLFKTVVVGGFGAGDAAVNIEVSADGISWAQMMTFHANGGQSGSFYGAFARARSDGPTPLIWMTGANEEDGDEAERWIRVPNMSTGRAWHHIGLLPNGRAMALGGSATGGQSQLASAEIFDVDTNSWIMAAPMLSARVFPCVHHLPVGKILVCGGQNPFFTTPAMFGPPPPFVFANAPVSSDIYDYATDTWTPTASIPNGAPLTDFDYRPVDEGSRFPQIFVKGGAHDGDPMVIGGGGFEQPPAGPPGPPDFYRWGGTKTAIRYDLLSSTWVTAALQMSKRRGYMAGACAIGGAKVLVVGGISYDGNSLPPVHPDQWTETCEVYDADGDSWAATDDLPVLIGEMSGAYPIVSPNVTPGYQARRCFGRAVQIGEGKALLIGGLGPVALNTPAGGIVDPYGPGSGTFFVPCRARATCWVYDHNRTATTRWRQTGSMQAGRMYPAVFTLDNGEIMVAGGIDELWSQGSYSTEIWNPTTETWRSGPDLPLLVPQPPGSQRPAPIFAGLSWGAGEKLTNGEPFVAGSHENKRIDEILESVFGFLGPPGGETALAVAAKFIPGTPSPGTPPGTPLATAAVDGALAFFLNFPLTG